MAGPPKGSPPVLAAGTRNDIRVVRAHPVLEWNACVPDERQANMKHRLRQPATILVAALAMVGLVAAAAQGLPQEGVTRVVATHSTLQQKEAEHARSLKLVRALTAEHAQQVRAQQRLFVLETAAHIRQVQYVQLVAYHDALVAQQAAAAAPRITRAPRTEAYASSGSGRCGGNLPPCCVMERESRGSLTAHNPHSSASGKWQFVNGTWNNFDGYPTAASAPESVQDAKAAQVWAGGRGRSAWGGGC